MRLRASVPKVNGSASHREVTAEETFRRIAPHLRRAGVTRVADITGLDRIGIPVFNAICPRSNDTVSVYNGKGETAAAARTSAVMEAIERFAAALPLRPQVVASYDELTRAGRPAIAPGDINISLAAGYHDGTPISWITGFDLIGGDSVLVPQAALGYGDGHFHEPSCYRFFTSNGLASGNSTEEAICHALTEIIERDAYTISDVVSRQLRQVLERRLPDPGRARMLVDRLVSRYPNIDPQTLPPAAARVAQMFTDAGVSVRIVHNTSDLGVATVRAITFEDLGPNTSQGHHGFGTHPDAEVAVLRALTECAQGRAVDIQAMREDITLPGADVPAHLLHVRRASPQDRASWGRDDPGVSVAFSSVPSTPSRDVMDDLRLMLDRLRSAGFSRAVVVDVSPPEMPVSVVRVIVPGAESWALDRGVLGRRAVQAWNDTITGLRTQRPGGDANLPIEVAKC